MSYLNEEIKQEIVDQVKKLKPEWIEAIDLTEVTDEILNSRDVNWALETIVDEYASDRVQDEATKAINELDLNQMVANEAESIVDDYVRDADISAQVSSEIEDQIEQKDDYASQLDVLTRRVSEIEELLSDISDKLFTD